MSFPRWVSLLKEESKERPHHDSFWSGFVPISHTVMADVRHMPPFRINARIRTDRIGNDSFCPHSFFLLFRAPLNALIRSQ